MRPDLALVRELIEESPVISARPGAGVPAAWIRAAESVVGTLPPSYRWWLTEYGSGTSGGARIATVPSPGTRSDGDDDITGGWRLDGDRLCFCAEPDGGDTYHFALDRQAGEEYAVVRRDRVSGQEELVADTFAGFLTVQVALSNGFGAGFTSALARLWRSTPGVLLPNGVLIYGPHTILERNETYQVGEYAPDWVLIGDDSGGSGLFMRRHPCDRTTVYLLDLGAGERDIDSCGVSEKLTDNLLDWLRCDGIREGRATTEGARDS
ncbi:MULTISPECIES: SMI1/KNR4 family protein [unclassified Streptomyces]|uniref:SMI1/KNR4 family protein n=1 Tax=unclassified Streptomyces TaxID=2593676 RepID=UPI00225575A3|nr:MULTISPECIES: SMI1/KNR4 family protein [unclassified Streptomyces]MCX4792926.1 SMI1/KNR4 family protein [Streptomyces sp. NBC_01242]WSP59575.1 SMI1/KNR4 family protein [Streptomyces sp. NBC_01241]WSP60829.1 SMI1/KNR4 family protein [Streptomyces sp. NBC_01240]